MDPLFQNLSHTNSIDIGKQIITDVEISTVEIFVVRNSVNCQRAREITKNIQESGTFVSHNVKAPPPPSCADLMPKPKTVIISSTSGNHLHSVLLHGSVPGDVVHVLLRQGGLAIDAPHQDPPKYLKNGHHEEIENCQKQV